MSFWKKVGKFYTQTVNPFYWIRKGFDYVAGTNTADLFSLPGLKDENEDKGIAGVDLNNVTTSDLLDLADDSTTTNVLAGAASAVPFVGPAISAALNSKSDLNDKQLGILQTAMEMQNNNEQAQINRDFQKQERLEVQDYNTEMWNMSNEYNSLEQQLSRARAAGVSPNAIIGQGSNSGFTSPVTSSPQSGSTASYSSGLGSTLINSGAMAENLMAQTKKLNTESNLNEQEFDFFKLTTPQRIALFNNDVARSALVNVGLEKDNNIKQFTIDTQQRSFEIYCQMSEEEIKLKKAQTTDLYNQNLERIQRINLLKQQAITEQKKQNSLQQDVYESTHRISLMNQQEVTEQQRSLIAEYEAEIAKIEKEFCTVMGVPAGTDESAFMNYLWMSGQIWNYYNALANKGMQEIAEVPGKVLSGKGSDSSSKSAPKSTPPYTGSNQGSKSVVNPVKGSSRPKRVIYEYD